jgi:hypothetical protein
MFGITILKKDPVNQMKGMLAQFAPEVDTWNQLASYLIKGNRPRQEKELAILRGYLDLRENLGPTAAFRLGVSMDYGSLAEPCRRFFAGRDDANRRQAQTLMHWGCFLLASDHLLTRAHEVTLAEKKNRSKAQEGLHQEWERCKAEFFQPLSHEMANWGRAADVAQRTSRGMTPEVDAAPA